MIDLTPGSPEWTRRITASKVAAILGVSPWESPRSLWHTMRGDVQRPEANDAQRRGTYLEDGVLRWWRDQHEMRAASIPYRDEWHEQWNPQPVFTLGEWAAATPDAVAMIGTDGEADWERVLVEAKTASYDDDWGDPGTDAIPAYYLVQVQWQMHVSGIRRCYVPVLTSRLRFAEYVVDYDEATGPLLERRCREFYDSLASDVPPDLDDTVATFETVKRLHPEIDRGAEVELTETEARDLVAACAELKEWEAAERYHRSRVIERMGRAQYATYQGVRIARRQPRGDAVTFVVTAKPDDIPTEGAAA